MIDEFVIKCMDYILIFLICGFEYFIDIFDRDNINDWIIYININISINIYNGWWFLVNVCLVFIFNWKMLN